MVNHPPPHRIMLTSYERCSNPGAWNHHSANSEHLWFRFLAEQVGFQQGQAASAKTKALRVRRQRRQPHLISTPLSPLRSWRGLGVQSR